MNLNPSSINVVLLAGGISGEREISIASGKGASEALCQAGFPVTVLDPADKEDLKKLIDGDFDVAFLCLHGRMGEDGAIQGLLEVLGIPYIGSGIWSSATAMDKVKAKVFYERCGISTPRAITLSNQADMAPEGIVDVLGSHVVVKPATEGSSLGMSIVEGVEGIESALDEAFKHDSEVLVETFVSGTELTIVVIGNEDVEALPIIQIVPRSTYYDFESKYAPGGSKHICPAPLDDETTTRVKQTAVDAHRALQCKGVSRTDIILGEDGTCWVLETNTVPGMTATSLLPDAGRAAGIEFPQLCEKLVGLALEGGMR